ncbi:hypothetical protein OG711_15995 [Streptomyces uncialis]|uniref:hypothetical protein n=1 Tax=Streptomyces uncialis TaxID=1048205 RepID=UPI002E37E7B3|nr:hypothetical protein [Streptomyces uncialis]
MGLPVVGRPTAGRLGSRALAALRHAGPALLVYTAVRVVCLVALAVRSAAEGSSPLTLLSARWDSLWYARVVEHGYDFTLTAPDGRVLSDMAFFPLLPWLERAVGAVTPLGPGHAGLAISAVASLAAAWGIHRVVGTLYGARPAFFAVVVWAALPVGIVQSMAYSESLFTALAAWSLYGVLRGDWVRAGLLASLAGLTRPVGLAVAAAVWAGMWLAWRRGVVTAARSGTDAGPDTDTGGDGGAGTNAVTGPPPWARTRSPTRAGHRRMLLGALLAPVGAASYVLWVGVREGALFGYLDVQAAWGNGFDGGVAFARFVTGLPLPAALGLTAGVAALLWLYWTGVRRGQPLPLLVYSGVVLALALGSSGYFGSKPRLLMPAFPLLIPLAVALARARPRTSATVAVLATAVAAWYGAVWLNGSGPP